MRRLLFLLLLLPIAFGYQIGDYTGHKPVFIPPGKEVNLLLPFPQGKNCLPVAVLFVKGGKDYPVINVNGATVKGSGTKRVVLEGNRVFIAAYSTGPAEIEANSLIYCTRDPFVFVKYLPPNPIRFGNYNYLYIFLKNYGYSEANVTLRVELHQDLAPFSPLREAIRIPPRSGATYTVFLFASPFLTKPSAHPRVCISYRDSLMEVVDCDGPVPASFSLNPRIECVENDCINASNLVLEVNEGRILPGDRLVEGDLNEINDINPEIVKITLRKEYKRFRAHRKEMGWVLLAIGAVFAGLAYVAFK